MKKFLNVLAWIFSVMSLISAASLIAQKQFIPACLTTLIGLCAFPPLWAWVLKQNIKAPVWARWGAGIILFGFLVGATPPPAKNVTGTSAENASVVAKTEQKPEEVAATKEQKSLDGKAFLDKIMSTVKDCDGYGEDIAKAAQEMDMLDMYQKARSGEDACYEASRSVANIDIPKSISEKNRKILKQGISTLSDGYSSKAYGFKQFQEIADGDMKPSKITSAKEAMELSQAQVLQAMVPIFAALSDEGVDITSYGDKG